MYSKRKYASPPSFVQKRRAVSSVIKVAKRRPGRSTISRIIRNPDAVYRFARTASLQLGYNGYSGFTSISGGLVYGNGMGFTWTLAGPQLVSNLASPGLVPMPNVSEFAALFDQYRIDNVHVKVFYTNNISNVTGAVSTFQQIALPTGQFCTDYDDGNAPTAQNELLQRPECKLLQWNTNGPLSFNISKPTMEQTVNTQSGVNSVAPRHGWCDMAATNTNLYGWKIFLESFGSNTAGGLQQGYFQFYFTYDLSFKGVR